MAKKKTATKGGRRRCEPAWLKLSRDDVRPSSRNRPPLPNPLKDPRMSHASEGERIMWRFICNCLDSKPHSRQDLDILCEGFARIIYGEDPLTALRLKRPKTGRPRRDHSRVMSIGRRITAALIKGGLLTDALQAVADADKISPESAKDHWRDYQAFEKTVERLERAGAFDAMWKKS